MPAFESLPWACGKGTTLLDRSHTIVSTIELCGSSLLSGVLQKGIVRRRQVEVLDTQHHTFELMGPDGAVPPCLPPLGQRTDLLSIGHHVDLVRAVPVAPLPAATEEDNLCPMYDKKNRTLHHADQLPHANGAAIFPVTEKITVKIKASFQF